MSWISVEDRLPETDGKNTRDYNVLVYIPKREGCRQHGIYVGKLANVPADDGSGNFWGLKTESSEWIVWSWGYYEHPVITHWMPLPKPPGEMTNGDRIRTMTDEELSKFLCDFRTGSAGEHHCAGCKAEEYCRTGHNGMIDWLQQPAKED